MKFLLGAAVTAAFAKDPFPANKHGDTWTNYTVSGLEVSSVVGGKDGDKYDTVVIMLHGGGASNAEWWWGLKSPYQQGLFDLENHKYVFPTSKLDGNVWYNSNKEIGCGLDDDCAYDIASIEESAAAVSDLIEYEKAQTQIGGDAKKVFLAGFSQGAQLTSYMQIAKLDYALGGAVVMDGFPLPPLCDMGKEGADAEEARKNATYVGDDIKFMIWHGEDDAIFPLDFTESSYANIFEVLGIEESLTVNVTVPGQGHELTNEEFTAMVKFIADSK